MTTKETNLLFYLFSTASWINMHDMKNNENEWNTHLAFKIPHSFNLTISLKAPSFRKLSLSFNCLEYHCLADMIALGYTAGFMLRKRSTQKSELNVVHGWCLSSSWLTMTKCNDLWISKCVGFIVPKPEFCYIIVQYRDFLCCKPSWHVGCSKTIFFSFFFFHVKLCKFRMFLKTLGTTSEYPSTYLHIAFCSLRTRLW